MKTVKTLLALCVLMPFAVSAAVRMENIEFSSLPGDKIEIRMSFDGTPPVPTGYTIEQPARIALDLMDVTSGLDSKYHPLGSGNARSVTVVEAGDRTRVIVSMTELVAYSTRIDGSDLYVLVGKPDSQGLVAGVEPGIGGQISSQDEPAVAATADVPVVEEIDFRRGEGGEGRVIVRLSDPGVGVDVVTQGGNIRIEFSGVYIPESLQRRLDVTDFATPVLFVDALPEAGNTVLTVEPTGDFDYLAYQADDLFTLEVKPLTAAELEASLDRAFRYRGDKLSLNFQDIEIRSVLQLIADFTDLNLVASDTIGGRITLRLKNVPWDQALDIILQTKGLDKRLLGNVLMVAPAAELAAREKLELETQKQASELAPLRTEFIEVRYAKASDLLKLFESSAEGESSFVSGRGSVIVDERTNSVIITETADRINDFRVLLERLDVPMRQVLIEARVITVKAGFTESIGIRWGFAGRGNYDNGNVLTQVGSSLEHLASIRDGQADGSPLARGESLTIDLGQQQNAFAVGFLDSNFLLDLELSALETQEDVETISRPKVITMDNQPARIESGFQIPYEEKTSSGATSISFIAASLQLNVTPQITPDGRVILELDVKNDSPSSSGSIETQQVQTRVLVSDGETLVLGGVFKVTNSDNPTKIPFLGELPMVGSLFRSKSVTETKDELLIFVTPRLIKDPFTRS